MTDPLLDHALSLHAAGVAVLPVRDDGSKAPAVDWKPYITTGPDEPQVRAWFTGTTHGLGIITGAVSGHLEMTELEGRAATALPDLRALAIDTGLGDLWDTITRGWVETSPSGGFHFHYRLTDGAVPGNTKLARRPSTDDELAAWKARETTKADTLDPAMRTKRLERIAATTHAQVPQVLAETRGEGGYVVVAPTPGTHHPTGRPWVLLLGGPHQVPTITAQQRDAFHSLLRTLDEMPAPDPAPVPSRPARDLGDGVTPGDDYETKTDWTDLLVPHGWTHISTRGRTRYWLRPGKDKGQGISATTGHADDRDRLFVFTSSTEFTPETPYTKFGAYALLEHAGDHTAAARELARLGFGEPATALRPAEDDLAGLIPPTNGHSPWTPTPASATSSTASTATAPDATPAVGAGAAPAPSTTTDRPTQVREAHPNEDNTALLLVDHHADTIRYCPGRGRWLTWNGHRWTNDDNELVREHARALARRLPKGEEWSRYRKTALSARGITGILRLAQSDSRIVAPIDALDARPYELNTPDGVVNLRTGTSTPPDPAALHTRSTTVAPDFDAPHPLWDAFLADTFAGNPTMTTYIQRLLGLSMVGVVLEQLFPFAHGVGANGKTTLLSVIQHLVGMGETGYAMSAPATMLLASRSEGHPTELARLSGARLVVTSELEDNQRFAEAKIKLLTGKDTVTGRFMRQDWFDFTPTHTLWLLANHQPEVRAGGIAFWRRIRLIPFEHTVPTEKRIPDLEDRLINREGPAILAWVLRGAADYFAHGLAEPETVRAATEAYQRDQDTIARFVDELCETGSPAAQHMKIRSAELRAAYETWCRVEGEEPVNPKAFTVALRTRYSVIPERSNTARYLAGIRLVEPLDDDDASQHASPDEPRWLQSEGW